MARTLELDTITEPGNSGTANITLSSDTTTTMPKVDINSGAIDNTTLGASTPSSVAATTISTTGNATIGATSGNQTLDVASHDLVDGGLKLGGTLVTASAAEINNLDGGTAATSTTLADADRVVVNDAGVMKQVALTDFETYMESSLDTLSSVTTVGALNSGSITSGFGNINNGSSTLSTGALTATTVNTGQGDYELYAMNQNVRTSDAVTFATVNTGQGANELYDMDQNVKTTDAVTFATVNTGQGANELYEMNQNVKTNSNVKFTQTQVGNSGAFLTHASVDLGSGGPGNNDYVHIDMDMGSATTSWANSAKITLNYLYNNQTPGALFVQCVWGGENDGSASDFASFGKVAGGGGTSWAVTGGSVSGYSGSKKGVRISLQNTNSNWAAGTSLFMEFLTEQAVNNISASYT